MPLYDYVCAACGRRFEVIHGVHADPPASCPLCGNGPVTKAITAPAVHYRGSGWAKKERRAAVKTGASSGSGEGSSDAGSSDAGSGSTKESGSQAVEPGSSTPIPAAGGESSKEAPKPSKSGTSSKTPARETD